VCGCGCTIGVGVGAGGWVGGWDVGVNEALEHPGMLGLERVGSGADGGMKCMLISADGRACGADG